MYIRLTNGPRPPDRPEVSPEVLILPGGPLSAKLKRPRKRLRIQPEIFDIEPTLCLKRRQTQNTRHAAHNEVERLWADSDVLPQ